METVPYAQGRQVIGRYGDGGFTVSHIRYEGSILVFPEHVFPWNIASLQECAAADLEVIFTAIPRPEILLLGCGAAFMRAPAILRDICRAQGVVLEVMDTGAACRTYNILLSEGRMVAAGLIAVP